MSVSVRLLRVRGVSVHTVSDCARHNFLCAQVTLQEVDDRTFKQTRLRQTHICTTTRVTCSVCHTAHYQAVVPSLRVCVVVSWIPSCVSGEVSWALTARSRAGLFPLGSPRVNLALSLVTLCSFLVDSTAPCTARARRCARLDLSSLSFGREGHFLSFSFGRPAALENGLIPQDETPFQKLPTQPGPW